jgi:hypothetical protein
MHRVGSERRLHLIIDSMTSICAMTLVRVLRTVAHLMLHADDLVLIGADSAANLLQLNLLCHLLHSNNIFNVALRLLKLTTISVGSGRRV